MKCPNCNFDNSGFIKNCKNCGEDIVIDIDLESEQDTEEIVVNFELEDSAECLSDSFSAESINETICPFCNFSIQENLSELKCPECGIAHHRDCWEENNFKCTVYGCSGISPTAAGRPRIPEEPQHEYGVGYRPDTRRRTGSGCLRVLAGAVIGSIVGSFFFFPIGTIIGAIIGASLADKGC